MPIEITAHVRLENGHHISRENMSRIVAVTDRLCTNVIHPQINPKTYKERWRVQKHPRRGFIFIEETHGGGINGYHPTLRQLIQATVCFSRIRVIVEDDSQEGAFHEIAPDGHVILARAAQKRARAANAETITVMASGLVTHWDTTTGRRLVTPSTKIGSIQLRVFDLDGTSDQILEEVGDVPHRTNPALDA